MNPSEIIDAARQMWQSGPESSRYWPRATAVLTRQAIEARIVEVLAHRAPGIEKTSVRAQLLCLVALHEDAEEAAAIAHTWGALTTSCHHHSYQLDPTASELASWMETADRFTRA